MIKVSAKQRMFIEVNEILKYMDLEIKNKIPYKIVKTIEILGVGDYTFTYDKTKTLNEQKISEDSKDMISYLYIKYCCDEIRKKEIYQVVKDKNEKRIQLDREKNWLLNRKYEEEAAERALTNVKKENIFTKFISKIKQIFKKK